MSCLVCKLQLDYGEDDILACTFCDAEAHYSCVGDEAVEMFINEDLFACITCYEVCEKVADTPTQAGK
jgi:hypothetical protein